MKNPKHNILILMSIFLACGCTFRERLDFANGQLYYQKPAEEQDAIKLGRFLVDFEFFTGGEKTVFLEKEQDHYLIRFMVFSDVAKQPKILAAFKMLKKLLSRDIFPDAQVKVLLVNPGYKTIAIVK